MEGLRKDAEVGADLLHWGTWVPLLLGREIWGKGWLQHSSFPHRHPGQPLERSVPSWSSSCGWGWASNPRLVPLSCPQIFCLNPRLDCPTAYSGMVSSGPGSAHLAVCPRQGFKSEGTTVVPEQAHLLLFPHLRLQLLPAAGSPVPGPRCVGSR